MSNSIKLSKFYHDITKSFGKIKLICFKKKAIVEEIPKEMLENVVA